MCLLALSLVVFATYVRTTAEASLAQVALIMGTVYAFAVLMSFVAIWRIQMEHIVIMTTVSRREHSASAADKKE